MTLIPSRHSFTIDLPPSCIVFCPTRTRLCLIGTYFLHPAERRSEQDDALVADAIAEGAVDQNAVPGDDGNGNDNDSDNDNVSAAQKRTGSLMLFDVDSARKTVTELATQSTDFAVLDAQWSPHVLRSETPLLAVAASTGLIALYKLHEPSDSRGSGREPTKENLQSCPAPRLEAVARHDVADPSTLILSLSWHPRRRDVLGFTQSDGRVRLVCLPQTSADRAGETAPMATTAAIRVIEVQAHGLEAWTLAFGADVDADTAQVLSGGDDIVLLCSSVAVPETASRAVGDGSADEDGNEAALESWRDRRTHQAGVTAILPLGGCDGGESGSLVVTGSYDDHIRLLAVASAASGRQRPRVLAEAHLGGGVWRLQRLDAAAEQPDEALLLASCMHAGARVVRVRRDSEGEWAFEVLARFEEHASMNYGSDVQPLEPGAGEEGGVADRTIVSTSFYDRRVCLWSFEDPVSAAG